MADRPPVQYIVVVGPSSDSDDTFVFGPYDPEEADEMAFQIEYDLGQSDRDITVTTLKRGLAKWFAEPDPTDETLVEIAP